MDVKDVTTVTTVNFETVTMGVTGVYETVTVVVTARDCLRSSLPTKISTMHAPSPRATVWLDAKRRGGIPRP